MNKIERLILDDPGGALRLYAAEMTDEQLESIRYARRRAHIPGRGVKPGPFFCVEDTVMNLRLKVAVLVDGCAAAAPWAALKYAKYRITPERLDKCAEIEPWTALVYAADRLTPERLD